MHENKICKIFLFEKKKKMEIHDTVLWIWKKMVHTSVHQKYTIFYFIFFFLDKFNFIWNKKKITFFKRIIVGNVVHMVVLLKWLNEYHIHPPSLYVCFFFCTISLQCSQKTKNSTFWYNRTDFMFRFSFFY